jgi:hypothetical protein
MGELYSWGKGRYGRPHGPPFSGVEGNFRLYCSEEELYALHLGQEQVWPAPRALSVGVEGNFRLYCWE